MDKWIDSGENDIPGDEDEEKLNRNLRKDMNESDSSHRSSERKHDETSLELRRQSAIGNKWQGDVGEGVTIKVATEKLGLTPDPSFDQPSHGMDGVYRDVNGNLIIVESKLAEKGINSLDKDQMQVSWVERNAKLMQKPTSEQFTPGNSKLGAEIIESGAEKIRRLVIVTDPRTLEAHIFEGQFDQSWKLIDSHNVFDLDQPSFT